MTARSLACPPLELGLEPELYAALTEVERRLWHVLVAALVHADGVRMREPEHLRDAVGIHKVIEIDSLWHQPEITGLVGSVRRSP